MRVLEIDTRNRGQVREFLDLPFKIYKSCDQWVPPLEMDAKKMLDRAHHLYYRESDAAFFMVFSDSGEALGRVAVLDNKRHNRYNQSKTALFYLLEMENDFEVFSLLIESAINWARSKGLTELVGPQGFTALNGMGMLVRGFDHRPALGIPYNHAYYPEFIERLRFKGIRDVVSGYFNRDLPLPEKVSLVAEKVQEKRGLVVRKYTSRSDLKKMLPHLKDLYNGSLVGTEDVTPMTDEEVKEMADQILWFADPRLIKVLMKDEQPVGFLLAYPDISAALQKTKGRIWPFGWVRLLRELKRTDWINVNGAGIIAEYRGMGGTAVLFNEMSKSVKEGRYNHADLVQIGVENERMQRELSTFGIDFYKTHRIYQRMI
ncbi:MAG: hypothetical protein Q8N39_01210 [Pelolinea sp.]|nr:hypothetical protein [Pelolinea sp.]